MSELYEFMQPNLNPKREQGFQKNTENEIIRSCLKSKFFEYLAKENLDLDIVANGKRNRNEQFHIFNLFIRKMYEEHKILMTDMILFLEEDWFEMKVAANCFNEENLLYLKEELAIKYHRKIRKSFLEDLIEEDI